ncbi:hypothetical protein [Aurantiacibacter poecillastricola]|uniref:hypothetical protein n=1 Tax=Aurantiacibacter poecillastricola TaxID=3064385 RepID=UPI00273D0E56|nr:hypothetical protein [Aurantiacibacter sp. 219JJ12-13]MDP5262913.1 hypothetical protein [Aurantiacibacter sp. 219JJ12-13]
MRLASTLAIAAMLAATPANAQSCDKQCLLDLADETLAAIGDQDYRRLPWADPVLFTENNVSLMIGDSWWGSAGENTGEDGQKALALADPSTGEVVWFGTIWDHDEPSFGAVRLKAPQGRIEEIEVIAARTPWPMVFGEPAEFAFSPAMTEPVPAAQRRPRERLVDLANAYLATKQRNNGALLAEFAPDCAMIENGVQITSADLDVEPDEEDCASVFEAGLFAPVDRIRDRRFPVVDTERGLVLAISVQDIPASQTTFRTAGGHTATLERPFPMSRLVAELVKIEGDQVVRSEGVATFLPYYMPTPWP